nr:hypothetical protein CFP56_21082 [Quercus suber]
MSRQSSIRADPSQTMGTSSRLSKTKVCDRLRMIAMLIVRCCAFPCCKTPKEDGTGHGHTNGATNDRGNTFDVHTVCYSLEQMNLCAYLALGASSTAAINPDILGNDCAFLRKLEVLLQLWRRSVECRAPSLLLPFHELLTLVVLEMYTLSACEQSVSREIRLLAGSEKSHHDCGIEMRGGDEN